MFRSAGVSESSRVVMSVSGPAQFVRTLVGPRPNGVLYSFTISFETCMSSDLWSGLVSSPSSSSAPNADLRYASLAGRAHGTGGVPASIGGGRAVRPDEDGPGYLSMSRAWERPIRPFLQRRAYRLFS